MQKKLKIAIIASECVPFAKTGGLADVAGALPKALEALGHQVIVILPKYGAIDAARFEIKPFLSPLGVWMGDSEEWCAVHSTSLDGEIPVYLIESKQYFGREGLYHDANFKDYTDNPRRFAFFSRAALQLCRDIEFDADIIHAHDWQTALAPAYLKIWHWNDPILGGAAGVLTIHNIGYQGKYKVEHYEYIGLQWSNFTPDKFEDYGAINFLKGGIYYADIVNTVSPTYARETLTPEMAWGLAPFLNNKGENYLGILNGVDYSQWNPQTDALIPANYGPDDLAGKSTCKEQLQGRFGLQVKPDIPLIGVVSRLAQQKGLDMLAATIEDIVDSMIVQFAVLGSGDQGLETFFRGLMDRYPKQIGTFIGFSNELAHWIEAGSDFFIMPSVYEPCGLNQIYSLKYGTLPIVRATGGLDDTVEQYNESTGEGTGFKYWDASPRAIYDTVGWAVSTYYDRKAHMEKMIQRAMSRRFSWEDSAKEYLKAYHKAIKLKRSA